MDGCFDGGLASRENYPILACFVGEARGRSTSVVGETPFGILRMGNNWVGPPNTWDNFLSLPEIVLRIAFTIKGCGTSGGGYMTIPSLPGNGWSQKAR